MLETDNFSSIMKKNNVGINQEISVMRVLIVVLFGRPTIIVLRHMNKTKRM